MGIAGGEYRDVIGGVSRPLRLRNEEIERFEIQHQPFGIYALWGQFYGRGGVPQVRHVRDLITLGLVGAGMGDRAADDLMQALPPSENLALHDVAQRLLGVAFFPVVLDAGKKKGAAGSRRKSPATVAPVTDATVPAPVSPTSAA
jgi:hypothetical protein